MIVFGCFAGALDITPARLALRGASGAKLFRGDGKARPITSEGTLRQRLVMALQGLGMPQGDQQIKGGVLADRIEQFHREVLNIGHDQRTLLGVDE